MVKIQRNFVGLASVSVGKKLNSARNPIFFKNRISLTLKKMLNNKKITIYAKTIPNSIGISAV